MKKTIYLFILIALCLNQSCYEDKGNYDYKAMNEAVIEGIKGEYTANLGKMLVINDHKINFKLSENSDVTYRWRIEGKVVSTEKNLEYMVVLPVKTGYYGDFSVIDNKTGIAYIQKFKLNISSEFSSGWMLLSEKDGHAKLDYINEEGIVEEDVFYKFNGTHLPASCRRMVEDLHSSWYESALGQIVLLSDEGVEQSMILDGASFNKVVSLKEEFIDQNPPVGLIPILYNSVGLFRYIVDQNGKAYVKYGQKGFYQEGYFSRQPVSGKHKLIPISAETSTMPGMRNGVLFFDVSPLNTVAPNDGNQYVYGYDGDIIPYDSTKDAGKKFEIVGMDKVLVASGSVSDMGAGRNTFINILKSTTNGQHYIHSLGFGMTYGRTPWMRTYYEIPFPDNSIIIASTVFEVERGRNRVYIASGSILYVCDIDIAKSEYDLAKQNEKDGLPPSTEPTRSITRLKNFGAGKVIKSIRFGLSADRGIYELGVAVDNGSNGDFYLLDVSSEGVAQPDNCLVFKSFMGLMGKPNAIIYKIGDPWRLN